MGNEQLDADLGFENPLLGASSLPSSSSDGVSRIEEKRLIFFPLETNPSATYDSRHGFELRICSLNDLQTIDLPRRFPLNLVEHFLHNSVIFSVMSYDVLVMDGK